MLKNLWQGNIEKSLLFSHSPIHSAKATKPFLKSPHEAPGCHSEGYLSHTTGAHQATHNIAHHFNGSMDSMDSMDLYGSLMIIDDHCIIRLVLWGSVLVILVPALSLKEAWDDFSPPPLQVI